MQTLPCRGAGGAGALGGEWGHQEQETLLHGLGGPSLLGCVAGTSSGQAGAKWIRSPHGSFPLAGDEAGPAGGVRVVVGRNGGVGGGNTSRSLKTCS